ncbi:MAG: hypothetical protein M1147_07900 [Nitrospirae bacterium]|nr:hypothetical protein [Nitrospirota bacterium]MCL5978031.1 hypothetical protein [Nitrospirota bacterium]
MPETIIADTSVLIALEKINLLHILCNLYKEIILPLSENKISLVSEESER